MLDENFFVGPAPRPPFAPSLERLRAKEGAACARGCWGCGSSNGEGLSRYLAENSSPGVLPSWGVAGPSWANAGYPDWVTNTEGTDRNYVSTGCAVIYLYWMRSMGFTISQIVQAGGATLADNYSRLTGKTTAYIDLVAAVKGLPITTDNPFAERLYQIHGDGTIWHYTTPPVSGWQLLDNNKRARWIAASGDLLTRCTAMVQSGCTQVRQLADGRPWTTTPRQQRSSSHSDRRGNPQITKALIVHVAEMRPEKSYPAAVTSPSGILGVSETSRNWNTQRPA